MGAAALELAPGPPGSGTAPPGVPDARAVMARAAAENFPVAARLLSPRRRRALLAVYGFARLADELGDELRGDRLAALDWLEDELDRAFARRAEAPLLRSLQRAVVECGLPREPFARLIEANRVDQRVSRYETWEQLQGYCELSANPVGELVLAIFDLHTPERVRMSDSVCTGLQLTEHLQDIGEDRRRGRFYIPREDLDRLGNLRATVEFEVRRARGLLWAGAPLAASIPDWRPKLAIAAFAAGGLAALEQIERAGCEVLAGRSEVAPTSDRHRSRGSAIGGVTPAGRRLRARWLGRVLRRARSGS
jgi:squalene synthase HpnC